MSPSPPAQLPASGNNQSALFLHKVWFVLFGMGEGEIIKLRSSNICLSLTYYTIVQVHPHPTNGRISFFWLNNTPSSFLMCRGFLMGLPTGNLHPCKSSLFNIPSLEPRDFSKTQNRLAAPLAFFFFFPLQFLNSHPPPPPLALFTDPSCPDPGLYLQSQHLQPDTFSSHTPAS